MVAVNLAPMPGTRLQRPWSGKELPPILPISPKSSISPNSTWEFAKIHQIHFFSEIRSGLGGSGGGSVSLDGDLAFG
jgi:hypothetical protein